MRIPSMPAMVKWEEALDHMREALKVLDETNAPPQIGAQLDLAICQLQEFASGDLNSSNKHH